MLALLSFDPCDPANAALVCQAQSALGFVPGAGVDGKWGADAAARVHASRSSRPTQTRLGCSFEAPYATSSRGMASSSRLAPA